MNYVARKRCTCLSSTTIFANRIVPGQVHLSRYLRPLCPGVSPTHLNHGERRRLSAVQTPLYRILEGYLLWPKRLADARTRYHVARRRKLSEAGLSQSGYSAALAEERRRRYPDNDEDFVPTALGNAIRRFEVYGWDRYRLNTQTLWYRIIAVVPDSVAKAAGTARANVDFFVSLLYGHFSVGALAVLALLRHGPATPRLLVAPLFCLAIVALSYRLSIVATDEWASAIRAIADLGRLPLAKSLGLILPQGLEEERQLWRAIYWLDRDGFSQEASDYISVFRTKPDD